jgi:hypothetical protein
LKLRPIQISIIVFTAHGWDAITVIKFYIKFQTDVQNNLKNFFKIVLNKIYDVYSILN